MLAAFVQNGMAVFLPVKSLVSFTCDYHKFDRRRVHVVFSKINKIE